MRFGGMGQETQRGYPFDKMGQTECPDSVFRRYNNRPVAAAKDFHGFAQSDMGRKLQLYRSFPAAAVVYYGSALLFQSAFLLHMGFSDVGPVRHRRGWEFNYREQ